MGMAFTIKGLQTSIILKDKEKANLQAAIDKQKTEIAEAHVQEKLAIENNTNSQKDLAVEKEKVSKLENKKTLHKILLWITAPVAIVETGLITLSYYLKK